AAVGGEADDDAPVGAGRRGPPLLERRLAGRQEAQLVQAEGLQRDPSDDQVAMVDGVERAAEEADGGHGRAGVTSGLGSAVIPSAARDLARAYRNTGRAPDRRRISLAALGMT